MNISDRIKMHDIMQQFAKFNGNKFRVTAVDVKKDLTLSLFEGYEYVDPQSHHFTPVVINDELDEKDNLAYLDRIHELLVLEIAYILVKEDKKTYHRYSGCLIKTYPGENGTCFLNINDVNGHHKKGIPINEILTVDYNEDTQSIVITFVNKKPAFKFSWSETKDN